MSLWLRRRDSKGNVHYYAIPFDPLAFITAVGVVMGLSLPLILVLHDFTPRQWLGLAIAIALFAGLTMFAIAKWSVIRSGTIISFGPASMTHSMRNLYFLGYAAMGCAYGRRTRRASRARDSESAVQCPSDFGNQSGLQNGCILRT